MSHAAVSTVRLNRREIKAIDEMAAPMGLTCSEGIKPALRWQLWDKAGTLILVIDRQAMPLCHADGRI